MPMILATLVILLPGICWWVWLGSRHNDPFESLAKIIAANLSLDALIALFFFLLKIKFSQTILIAVNFVFLLLVLTGLMLKREQRLGWVWLPALIVFGGLVFWRFFQARELVLPAWVDSLHHVLIVRVILEKGGLPADLSPYLPGPFYYHFNFHIFVAHFSALSGLAPARAVLILGQVLNAGISLSVYSLAKVLFKDWRAAAVAGLLTTFATMMPAYYLSWGRYTLLSGMLLLPLAMAEAIRLKTAEDIQLWDYIPFVLFTSGSLLAHYFSAFLLAAFLVLYGIWALIEAWRKKSKDLTRLVKLTAAAVFGMLIVSPWLWRVFNESSMGITPNLNLPANLGAYLVDASKWSYVKQLLGPASGWVLIPLALVGMMISFLRPRKRAFASWSLALFLLALPWGIQLGSFRSDHFIIVLFLPISILSAYAIGQLGKEIGERIKIRYLEPVTILLVCLGMCAWGAWLTRNVINQETILVNEADYQALTWIEANIPGDARFFINTTSWGFGLHRGVDGGAWIMPFSGRWSLVPTIFYPFGRDATYTNQIKDWNQRASTITGCTAEFWSLVEDANLSHVYVREGVGSLQPEALQSCEGINLVYSNAETFIWGLEKQQ